MQWFRNALLHIQKRRKASKKDPYILPDPTLQQRQVT
jgi:hypothetical protein